MARRSKDLTRILAKLDRLGKEPRQKIVDSLLRLANRVAALQKQFAEDSRDTGALIDSITVTAPGHATPTYSQPGGNRIAGPTEVIIKAGDENTRYTHLVEFGSVNAEAKPYFWPAWRLLRNRETSSITRDGRKLFRDIWSGRA